MADLLEHEIPNTSKRVEFGTRLLSSVLDVLIKWVLVFTILLFFFADQFSLKDITDQLLNKKYGGAVEIYNIVSRTISYSLLMLELFTGITIAKYILGLRIGDLNGSPAPLKNLFIRGSLKVAVTIMMALSFYLFPDSKVTPGTAISLLWCLGCLAALSSSRQAFHDVVGKTAVYRKKDMVQPS